MSELQLFLSVVGLGVAYSAAPGPVNTEALRRGLAHGFRPALVVQLGALFGDAVWAALALAGAAFLVGNRPAHILLGLAGACFLLRLAWSALQEARSGGLPAATMSSSRGDFATGLFFSLANPFGLAFWSGLGSGFAGAGASDPAGFALLLAGFALGAAIWCVGASLAVAWGQRILTPSLLRWVAALSALALGYFGLRLLWQTLRAAFEEQLTLARLHRALAPLAHRIESKITAAVSVTR